MTNYNADNLVESIDWSRHTVDRGTDPEADDTECGAFVQVQDGRFVPWSGDEGEPWLCWATGEEEYTEAEVVGDFG